MNPIDFAIKAIMNAKMRAAIERMRRPSFGWNCNLYLTAYLTVDGRPGLQWKDCRYHQDNVIWARHNAYDDRETFADIKRMLLDDLESAIESLEPDWVEAVSTHQIEV